ncbi:uncharacterized protein LOC113873431 [Abrus precatorius]|uniref:Uncharacterized protein LOC113873431 n=1 Tax=Abrus precatorius TaxID=3816 RepID=A0A8B8MHH7_ABRPR|nr:uncharacterized protein LOC113873431 [Abrus precatorius]
MNTKTMRLPPRRVLTPSGTTNKRKERDDPFDRPKPIPATPTKLLKPDKPIPRPGSEPITGTSNSKGSDSKLSNQLLAGYLAHEYLTKGTLLGQPWGPARAEGGSRGKSTEEGGGEDGEAEAAPPCRRTEEELERYTEVAGLLNGGGAHLPGVVNPTQLSRFLHL